MGDVHLIAEPHESLKQFSVEQLRDLQALGFVASEYWGDKPDHTTFKAQRVLPLPEEMAKMIQDTMRLRGIVIRCEFPRSQGGVEK